MEGIQGPINNPCFNDEHLDLESLIFEEHEESWPFFQMLQSGESSPLFPLKEPNFQTLMKLQNLKKQPWDVTNAYMADMGSHVQGLELESCVTHAVKEEIVQNLHANSGTEQGLSSECNQVKSIDFKEGNSGCKQTQLSKSPPLTRRKRKRTRPTKNKEEVENQRMTHIAVERNRRRQMNDHLNILRSLMPISYIQRGDQASIIGGAIDFVKELEQLVESMEVQKKIRNNAEYTNGGDQNSASPPSTSSAMAASKVIFPSSQNRSNIGSEEESSLYGERNGRSRGDENNGVNITVEKKSEVGEIEVTVIQSHVNLKIQCRKKPGQLLKAIVALDQLWLTVLHLNITSSQDSVFYSFNLKIEDECKLGSASEIAGAVHKLLSFISNEDGN